jgi:uncharacterized membrane protein YdbT with pleckstrin-like domain
MSRLLLEWLRVPHEPTPPEGSPDSIKVFRAGVNYYRWRLVVWAFSWFGSLIPLLVVGLIVMGPHKLPPLARTLLLTGEAIFFFVCLVVILPCSYLMQRLNYEQRWYIVTDRSLRIRAGIWSVEELTMTFANIQDIRITSGPLQKFLGLADLEVASAGGGSTGPKGEHIASSHIARFAGVDNAEQIRDLIQDRLRHYRDAGLGDPNAAPAAPTVDQAAATLLAEARALRAVRF